MVWAVLPLKDFVNAKQRLSGVLAPHERRHLFHTMVEDVLDVLANHPLIENTVIVSDDPSAELLADRYQLSCWPESSLALAPAAKGLSAVVDAAAVPHFHAPGQLIVGATDRYRVEPPDPRDLAPSALLQARCEAVDHVDATD